MDLVDFPLSDLYTEKYPDKKSCIKFIIGLSIRHKLTVLERMNRFLQMMDGRGHGRDHHRLIFWRQEMVSKKQRQF